MPIEYERLTLDHPNPIARFAHRARFARSMETVIDWLAIGQGQRQILDYGCGQGRFLHELHRRMPEALRAQVTLTGFDPYMAAKYPGFQVIASAAAVPSRSVDILTCLEVCEHLDEEQTRKFLVFVREKVADGGFLLVTVPVMMGPALFPKEFARSLLFRRRPDLSPWQMIRAGIFGLVPARTRDLKRSHRGYDWRLTRDLLRAEFGNAEVDFSPFRWLGWYGNSQAFMRVRVGR
jgi:2-polyprenyl-3-methyl-5-hydroxy-6-metoxy-1,4-benzoquinol methylase